MPIKKKTTFKFKCMCGHQYNRPLKSDMGGKKHCPKCGYIHSPKSFTNTVLNLG